MAKNRYQPGTVVFTIYGGVYKYGKALENGEHELICTLTNDVDVLSTEEFDSNQRVAWGRKRAV